ncbi:MAG TPA: zf-HC2 domain-containing protein [Terracidiphilus sp.]
MTNCTGAPARQWLEQYVEGTLPENEAQKFEDHYFDCPVCLGELQALQTAQAVLRQHPVTVTAAKHVLAWPTNWNKMMSFGALAAALLIGFFAFRMIAHGPQQTGNVAVAPAQGPTRQAPAGPAKSQAPEVAQPEVEIAQLADLQPPTYNAPVLRGNETADAAFESGMKQYIAGDCAGAMNTLSQVDPSGPDGLAAQFYSGACRMHTGDLAGATASLRHIAEAGDSPYQESAFYYLAQIALAQSDAAAARRELNHVVLLRGDLEHRARKQLTEIPSGK